MTDSEPDPCDDCDCGLADETTDTTTLTVDTGMDFSVIVRDYLEGFDGIDEDAVIQKVEICPEETVVTLQS